MKILHTADWHLGKRLDHFSRIEEQKLVMQDIVDIADSQNVDIVIVAGDLFDTINPSTDAVELFYKTLKQLSKNGNRPVLAIAGNHDSPSLIDAPDPLARVSGIFLVGYPNAIINNTDSEHFKISKTDKGFVEFQLNQYDYPIRILHTAYANEVRLKQALGENKEDALNEVLAENWNNLALQYCDNKGVNILTAHLYMNKKGAEILEEPDGEKPIKIGNADMIYSEAIPEQIQYTALGHIHRYQNIGTKEKPVVYSSSPLCYSFSEAGQTKYVQIINAEPNQNVQVEKMVLQNGKPLCRVTFNSVEKAMDWLTENQNALVELTLESDSYLKAEERKRLYQSHQGIIHLNRKTLTEPNSTTENNQINLNQNLPDLFKDYFKTKNNGQEPNDDIMNLLNEIIH